MKKEKFICKEAEKMVIPYIRDELDHAQLRAFTAHIRKCPDCREELETYYIVYKGLMQLDEKEELPMNIIEALNEDLHLSEQYLKNVSLFCVLSEILRWLVNLLCVLLMMEIMMKLFLGV